MCHDRFERAVVACMHHCPYPNYCANFYDFWKKRRLLPVAYFNEQGIGESVMRRIVIDCDRCGKKDVSPFYSRFTEEGEGAEYLRDAGARKEMIERLGYPFAGIGEVVFTLLERLETDRKWFHYCEKCFSKITDAVATIYDVKKSPRKGVGEVRELRKRAKGRT
ncbi:MAG: hypothetical protein D6795_01490 [Deltaproteobacteria bacterium]|nr:MAG: hypothetical protein D6795_01490 [Deltaproteobacteria bacterium]